MQLNALCFSLLYYYSRISWETVKDYYTSTCKKEGAKPVSSSGHPDIWGLPVNRPPHPYTGSRWLLLS